jgi:hypothetical protein
MPAQTAAPGGWKIGLEAQMRLLSKRLAAFR